MKKENKLQIRNSTAEFLIFTRQGIVGEGCPRHVPACKPSRVESGRISREYKTRVIRPYDI